MSPFGLSMERDQVLLQKGVQFGRKNQLSYKIYSPIEGTFHYDYRNRILSIEDSDLHLTLRIHGVRTLDLSYREPYVTRGQLLGTAFQIHALRSSVYVECVISHDKDENSSEAEFMTSEERLEEWSYIREASSYAGIPYKDAKVLVNQSKRKERILRMNPLWLVSKPKYRPLEVYINYSSVFC